jgi:hypothetical protein
MASKYAQIISGEEFKLDNPQRLACCGCGLVHDMTHRIKNGRVYLTMVVNARATTAKRRRCKYDYIKRKHI